MLPGGIGVTGFVVLALLVVGVLAGRAKRRWSLLLLGLVAVVVVGVAIAATSDVPSGDRAAGMTAIYTVTTAPVIAFVAGWLCAKGSWLRRFIVIAAAAILLAAFPYAAAGAATAGLVRDAPPGAASAR